MKKNEPKTETKTTIVKIKESKISTIERDSTLELQKVDLIYTYSDKQVDTLIGFCNCEKNVKKTP